MIIASVGLSELIKNVDTLVFIPNQRILDIVDPDMSLRDSLKKADEALRQGVRGIAELITNPGIINVDFADVKTIMLDKGLAHMGIGRGNGKNRAEAAAESAINSPLPETSIDGAKYALINVAGGPNLSISDFSRASEHIKKTLAHDAELIIGTSIDESLSDEVVVTVIATGFNSRAPRGIAHISNERTERPLSQENTYTPPSAPAPGQPTGTSNGTPPAPAVKEREVLQDIKDSKQDDEDLTLPVFLQNRNRYRPRD